MLGSEQQMREEGNLKDNTIIPDTKLTPHLNTASSELRRLLGSAYYDAIENEDTANAMAVVVYNNAVAKGYDGLIADWLTMCFTECAKAESNLALSFAVYPLNMETSGSGIVSSTGWDDSRRDLLRSGDIDSLINHFRQVAMNLLSPYMPIDIDQTDPDEPPDNVSYGGLSMGAV